MNITEEQTDQALERLKESKKKGDQICIYIRDGYINMEQVNLLHDIMTMIHKHQSKDSLLKLAGVSEEDIGKIDSAYPIEYYRRIEEIYPPFKDQILCYAYHEDKNGTFFNIGNAIAKRILKTFS